MVRSKWLGGVFLPDLAQAVVELAALGLALATIGATAWSSRALDPRRAILIIVVGGLVAVVASSIWLFKAELVARQMLAAGSPQYQRSSRVPSCRYPPTRSPVGVEASAVLPSTAASPDPPQPVLPGARRRAPQAQEGFGRAAMALLVVLLLMVLALRRVG